MNGEITTDEALDLARAMLDGEREHPQDNEHRVLIVPPPPAYMKGESLGSIGGPPPMAQARREMRADVLKIMRRMHQRISEGRWSGVPT